jgi:hypothetical protein
MNTKRMATSVITMMMMMAVFAAIAVTNVAAQSTTLYVISDNAGDPATLEAYGVDAVGTGLTLLTPYGLTQQGNGPVGTALDDTNDKLFVSYESRGTIFVFDATNFNQIANIATPGGDIAGMIVDTATSTLYAVDRGKSTIYMYDTNTYTPMGTGTILDAAGNTVRAVGLAFDSNSNELYVTDWSSTVYVYDASTFALVTTYNVGNTAVGIAVDFSDPSNVCTYTTDLMTDGTLTKYNTNTGTSIVANVVGMPTGVTVDPITQMAYITVGWYGGANNPKIEVYDMATMNLQNTVNLPVDWTPTDLFIGEVRFRAEEVPAMTPIGIAALIGLLGLIGVGIVMRRR